MNNWLDALQKLPLDLVSVAHQPMTPRYSRAIDKRIYLLREGVLLGERSASYKQAVEVALFAENPNGNKKPGYYAGVRIFLDEKKTVLSAVIFCFYDGTEKSPGFKNVDAAFKYALEGGFS
jgi:hypothetical protein